MTTITISDRTKDRLASLGRIGDTYEDVILKLLDSSSNTKDIIVTENLNPTVYQKQRNPTEDAERIRKNREYMKKVHERLQQKKDSSLNFPMS